MNLYFLRHAKAGPHRRRFKPDSKRPLTQEGEKQARKVACGIRELNLKLEMIVSSPYVRAFQTAQIAADVLGTTLHTTENLGADVSPEKLVEHLNARYSETKNILLVGHEPYLSKLMSVLLSGKADMRIDFKKAGLAKLSVDHGFHFGKCACLHWILTPKQVAKFGK